MKNFSRYVLERLRGRRAGTWGAACRAGAPLPESRCTSLDCDSVSLTAMRVGAAGTISCLQEPESRAVRTLVAMGVLPGVDILLVQTYPAFVFRLGRAEFAIDATLADHIRVYPA